MNQHLSSLLLGGACLTYKKSREYVPHSDRIELAQCMEDLHQMNVWACSSVEIVTSSNIRGAPSFSLLTVDFMNRVVWVSFATPFGFRVTWLGHQINSRTLEQKSESENLVVSTLERVAGLVCDIFRAQSTVTFARTAFSVCGWGAFC